jgi:hypothetical protein
VLLSTGLFLLGLRQLDELLDRPYREPFAGRYRGLPGDR